MNQKTKDLVFAALCVALGLIVPQVFHLIPFVGAVPNLGGVFLPMHIPVLLCGFLCGWKYGAVCGAVVPFLSSIATGMPVMWPQGVSMIFELAVYGHRAALPGDAAKYLCLPRCCHGGRAAGLRGGEGGVLWHGEQALWDDCFYQRGLYHGHPWHHPSAGAAAGAGSSPGAGWRHPCPQPGRCLILAAGRGDESNISGSTDKQKAGPWFLPGSCFCGASVGEKLQLAASFFVSFLRIGQSFLTSAPPWRRPLPASSSAPRHRRWGQPP